MLFCSSPYYNANFVKLLQMCTKLLIFHLLDGQLVLIINEADVFYYKKVLKLL